MFVLLFQINNTDKCGKKLQKFGKMLEIDLLRFEPLALPFSTSICLTPRLTPTQTPTYHDMPIILRHIY